VNLDDLHGIHVYPESEPSDASVPTAIREIHPIDGETCIEMYTACEEGDDGEICHGAPYELPCGVEGTVPVSGDKIRCVCP